MRRAEEATFGMCADEFRGFVRWEHCFWDLSC